MRIQSFINGVLVGLLLGVLFAPDSGVETRRKLSRKAADLRDSMEDKYDEMAGSISNKMDRAKNKADELMNKGERKFNQVTDDARNMYES
jgi:gas vesicle protein